MADAKLDLSQTLKSGQSKKAPQSSGSGQPLLAVDRQDGGGYSAEGGADDKSFVTVVRRKQRYLIGFRRPPGIRNGPRAADPFIERLAQMEGVEIIRRLQSHAEVAESAGNSPAPAAETVVVRMDEQSGEALRMSAPPHVIVEIDEPLLQSEIPMPPDRAGRRQAARAMPFPRRRHEFRFLIQSDGDRPVANAAVSLYGPGFPVQGVTDTAGRVSLPTFGLSGDAIAAVYVRPAADYWERVIHSPLLEPTGINVIRVTALRRGAPNPVDDRSFAWGQRLMKFDRLAAQWNGAGARIGVIDSGCDVEHPLLHHVVEGADFTRDGDSRSWKSDELGQGTHCAGIVSARAPAELQGNAELLAAVKMAGCAPGAELHVYKVVPGGHYSDLLDALDRCIERRLDLVQIGVCGATFSELVAQKITEARLQGIACIAGAGNGGGAVEFPGNVPGVLTVAALGKWGEFPADSRHAQRAVPSYGASNGLFAANFSAQGREVGVCAPGVAVLSSVPGGGYASWDGSAMAAAHVTGFAALLLAHHPMLQSIAHLGDAERRVAVLFDLIGAAAAPPLLADSSRVGAGLPDWQRVPAILPASAFGIAGASMPIGGGAPQPLPAGYLGSPLAAIMQLRAAGLWI